MIRRRLRRAPADERGERRSLSAPRPARRPARLQPHYDPEAFGRFSEAIARNLGTARFLVIQSAVVVLWIIVNITAASLRWDPYPFILLNLAFSTQAAYAAPLILLAQNRQAERDRIAMEDDRRRTARSLADTEYLAREIAGVRLALGDTVTRDYLRSELNRLGEVGRASCRERV